MVGVVLLLAARPAEAYIGPGAGFALLSSFLVVFTTIILAFVSLLIWPFRLAIRASAAGGRQPLIKRLIVVGFDGQDPKLTDRFMPRACCRTSRSWRRWAATAGCGPRSRRCRRSPGRRSAPARIPARHNIFDFLDRDRRTYLPLLSSTRIGKVERFLKLGRFRIPLRMPELRLLRQVEAVLDDPRRAPHLEHDPARADHVPARPLLRRAS